MPGRRTNQTLIEEYLHWLEGQLRDEHGNPQRSYWELTQRMAEKPFESLVSMDDNRMQDGLDLRVEFAHEIGVSVTRMMELGPCSFLEVLIGLSRRLAFNAGGAAPGWAWHLLCNLELDRMWDPMTRQKRSKTEEILVRVILRQYQQDGTGGFFPLAFSEDDQTRVELWYQMHAYIAELHPEHR
jgi:hypothetical protein